MKHRLLTLLFCAVPFAAMAEPDAEAIKAAEELTKTMGLEKQMQSGFNAMLPAIDGMAKRLNLTPEATTELKEIYRTWFNEDIDQKDLHQKLITIYAKYYTKDELAELNKFYLSPLGQKTLATMPEVMKESSMLGMQAAQAQQGKLQERLKPFMEKYNPKQPALGQ